MMTKYDQQHAEGRNWVVIIFPRKSANIFGGEPYFQTNPSLPIPAIFHSINITSPLHLLCCWLFIILKHTQRSYYCFYIPSFTKHQATLPSNHSDSNVKKKTTPK